MDIVISVLAGAGFLLSTYALWVRWRTQNKPGYKSLCDFTQHISCSKAFSSKEGKLFLMPNPVWGLFFYAAVLVWNYLDVRAAVFILSILSVLVSVYLASILYLKQKNFCIVCSAIYLINLLLYIFSM